jgi:large subunit ribosomal protein L9
MKVILQKNVQKLGKIGDVVESKPGYYRNFLQPRGLAVVATTGSLKKRDEELEALRAKADKEHQAAIELGEKINAIGSVKIIQRAGDGGKLYGKVTNKDIAEAVGKELGAHVDKKGVKTLEEITSVGTYKVYIKVTPEVQSEVNVIVYDATQGEPPAPKPVQAQAEEEAATEETAEAVS